MDAATPDWSESATPGETGLSPKWGVLFGVLVAYSEMIVRLLSGKTLVDSVWPHAVRSLEWTLGLRASPTLTLSLFLVAGMAAYGLRTLVKSTPPKTAWLALPYAALGLLFGLISLHLLLDVFYLRGAFLMLPTLMGWALACLLIALGGPPALRSPGDMNVSTTRVFHVLGVFFAAWLVMPGIPALAGFAPSPPAAPAVGYGSFPGPYTLEQYRFPYDLPEEVAEVRGPLEDDVDFSVYVTLPNLPEDLPFSKVPLAVLLHGFGYPDIDAYQGWISHLGAKGIAVAFIQYPSDLRPSGYEDHEAAYEQGTSDYLQHTYRDLAIRAGLDHLDGILLGTEREAQLEEHLGEVRVDPSSLWVGGHSLGAAYTFISLDSALERGWGTHALVVALEAPASRPMQATLQPNLSSIPEETFVQIGVPQDDMSVGMCPGAFHQRMFNALPTERNQLIEIQSDHYGYPRLVASHYLQTDPARDTLSDWSFYRRIDAQADYLVAHGRNDTFTADWAYQYMTDETMLTGMGEWSDGTPVLPLIWHRNAIEDVRAFQDCN
jgi:hypothetical protein